MIKTKYYNKIVPKSILVKLLFVLTLLITGVVISMTMLQTNSQKLIIQSEMEDRISLMREGLINRARIISNNLARQTEFAVTSNDFSNLSILSNKAIKYDSELFYIILMDKKGFGIIHTLTPKLENTILKNRIDTYALQQKRTAIKEYKMRGDSFMEFIIPIKVNKQQWGILRIGYSLDILDKKITLSKQKIQKEINRMYQNSLFTALISIFISGLIVYLISKRITFPITELTGYVKQVSEGTINTDETKVPAATGEVGVLAQTFYEMTQNLKRSEYQLKEFNKDLQNKNDEYMQAKEEAEKATYMKREFLISVSEELKGPLKFIFGTNDVLLKLDLVKKNKGLYSSIEMIKKTTTSLLGVIEKMLNLQKLESDATELHETEFNFPELLGSYDEMMIGFLAAKEVTFEKEIDNCPTQLYADKEKLNEVIKNILNNAAKYTADGKIILAINEEDDRIIVTISDTGVGIDPNQQETIFDPITDMTAGKFEDLGIGLSLSKQMLLHMKGDISVESTPNKGSTFTFWIPKSQA